MNKVILIGKAAAGKDHMRKVLEGRGFTYGTSYTTNDIIGVAMDLDNGAVYFSKNGSIVFSNSYIYPFCHIESALPGIDLSNISKLFHSIKYITISSVEKLLKIQDEFFLCYL